jgi:hypothetical protein
MTFPREYWPGMASPTCPLQKSVTNLTSFTTVNNLSSLGHQVRHIFWGRGISPAGKVFVLHLTSLRLLRAQLQDYDFVQDVGPIP